MSGWIRLQRAVFADPDFQSAEPMSEREAWIWLIANAAWKDTTHRVGSNTIPVARGSAVFTLRGLQKTFGWKSDTKVRKFLQTLENAEKVQRTTIAKGNAQKTHITICNYAKFQDSERTESAEITQNERTKNALKEQGNNKQDIISSSPARNEQAATQDDFDRFWFVYPHKVNEVGARRAFPFACMRAPVEEIISGAIRYANKQDDSAWMNPVNWLDADRWRDKPAVPIPKQSRPRPQTRRDAAIERFLMDGEDEQTSENDVGGNVLQLSAKHGS